MIKLTDIEKVYQTKTIETVALNHVNLSSKGEFLSMMGPSGCGKSPRCSASWGCWMSPRRASWSIDGQR